MSEITRVCTQPDDLDGSDFEPDSIETVDSESFYDFDEIDLTDLYMLVCQDCKKQIPLDIVEFRYFESQLGDEDDFICENCADVRIFSEFDLSSTSH